MPWKLHVTMWQIPVLQNEIIAQFLNKGRKVTNFPVKTFEEVSHAVTIVIGIKLEV